MHYKVEKPPHKFVYSQHVTATKIPVNDYMVEGYLEDGRIVIRHQGSGDIYIADESAFSLIEPKEKYNPLKGFSIEKEVEEDDEDW